MITSTSPAARSRPNSLHSDLEYSVAYCETALSATHYAADTFPCATIVIGHTFMATPVHFETHRIRTDIVLDDCASLPVFDMESPG